MANRISRFLQGTLLKRKEYFRPIMIGQGRHVYAPWVEIKPGGHFDWRSGAYKIRKDRIFFMKKTPSAVYNEGNPDPVNIDEYPLPQLEDADGRQISMGAEEFRGAIEAEAVKAMISSSERAKLLFALILGFVNMGITIVGIWLILDAINA